MFWLHIVVSTSSVLFIVTTCVTSCGTIQHLCVSCIAFFPHNLRIIIISRKGQFSYTASSEVTMVYKK